MEKGRGGEKEGAEGRGGRGRLTVSGAWAEEDEVGWPGRRVSATSYDALWPGSRSLLSASSGRPSVSRSGSASSGGSRSGGWPGGSRADVSSSREEAAASHRVQVSLPPPSRPTTVSLRLDPDRSLHLASFPYSQLYLNGRLIRLSNP